MTKYDFLVVGSGFAGSTVAERLANAGRRVLVVDRRPHVGGNAFDEIDAHGVRVHRYGPHIFHTNSKRIVDYLSCFTEWRSYEHRVRAHVNGNDYPMPINRDTVNQLYGLELDEAGVQAHFESVREARQPIQSSEDVVLATVGRDLYEKFYLNYTRKQWGMEPKQLAASVAARIPVRTNSDDRYFTDTHQMMPSDGYTHVFLRMLNHPNIALELSVDFEELRSQAPARHIVFTGPIDAYFGYCFGKLPYRSLRFEHEYLHDTERFQSVGTINYPNDHDFTRITEFKHLTGQSHRGTSIVREFPQAEGEPFYPIPCPNNETLYERYRQLAMREKDVTFVGRLAQYRYYNMDQVVSAGLRVAARLTCESEVTWAS